MFVNDNLDQIYGIKTAPLVALCSAYDNVESQVCS